MNIFVYGTLLSNLHNHDLLKNATFIHNTSIQAKMYNLGAFPAIQISNELSDIVHGELYKINEKTLERLDQLEGYQENRPNNLYNRITITTHSNIETFTYVAGNRINLLSHQQIQSGNWKEYLTIKTLSTLPK